MTMKKFKLPHTFVLLFAILVLIAAATWLVPGGRYERTRSMASSWSIRPASSTWPPRRKDRCSC
jgi:uncharacterized ion transporter superfamily protein YfcC